MENFKFRCLAATLMTFFFGKAIHSNFYICNWSHPGKICDELKKYLIFYLRCFWSLLNVFWFLLAELYTKKMFQLLLSAYSTISIQDTALFLGMSEDDATNCKFLFFIIAWEFMIRAKLLFHFTCTLNAILIVSELRFIAFLYTLEEVDLVLEVVINSISLN